MIYHQLVLIQRIRLILAILELGVLNAGKECFVSF